MEITCREAGRLGGKRIVELYGREHFRKLGQASQRKQKLLKEQRSKGGTSSELSHG